MRIIDCIDSTCCIQSIHNELGKKNIMQRRTGNCYVLTTSNQFEVAEKNSLRYKHLLSRAFINYTAMILDTIKAKRNESQEIKQDVKQEETVYQCLHRHAISLEYTTYASSNLYKLL